VAVKVGSPDDVAHALRHLMNNKKQLYDMSSNAYDYVAKAYTPSGYAQTLSDLINS
jgi:hypothetical protein